ncbi:MAG: branched-chain amino acid ABC transporter permease [Reyranellaceae bacterium]
MLGYLAELIVRGVLLGAVYGLLALPMSLTFVTVGSIDFALGAYAVLAAAVGASVSGVFGMAAGLAAALAAASVMAAIFAGLKRAGVDEPITISLASFGLAVAIGSLILWRWGTAAFVRHSFDDVWVVLGIRLGPQSLLNFALGLALLAIVWALLYRTGLGRMMRAAAINPTGAELAGIPVTALQTGTFVSGGLLGGIAGLLILFSAGLDFTAGLSLTLSGFGAAILFGAHGPVRAFLGGILMGVVEALSAGLASGAVSAMAPLVVIMIVLALGTVGGARFSGDRP